MCLFHTIVAASQGQRPMQIIEAMEWGVLRARLRFIETQCCSWRPEAGNLAHPEGRQG